jgi:hypothetical protein
MGRQARAPRNANTDYDKYINMTELLTRVPVVAKMYSCALSTFKLVTARESAPRPRPTSTVASTRGTPTTFNGTCRNYTQMEISFASPLIHLLFKQLTGNNWTESVVATSRYNVTRQLSSNKGTHAYSTKQWSAIKLSDPMDAMSGLLIKLIKF